MGGRHFFIRTGAMCQFLYRLDQGMSQCGGVTCCCYQRSSHFTWQSKRLPRTEIGREVLQRQRYGQKG